MVDNLILDFIRFYKLILFTKDISLAVLGSRKPRLFTGAGKNPLKLAPTSWEPVPGILAFLKKFLKTAPRSREPGLFKREPKAGSQ